MGYVRGTEKVIPGNLLFDIWFASMRSAKYVMDVVSGTIGTAKTNIKKL